MANPNDFRTSASIETLKHRATILKETRRFFDDLGFFEVETPILSHDIVVDRYLEPVSINADKLSIATERGKQLWLQTSPEFAMKRIIASGASAIYQLTKAFRCGEIGNRHNPEFTMLEWYRVGDNQNEGINLLGQFIQSILNTEPAKAISYQDAFITYAKIDPFSADLREYQRVAVKHNIDCSSLLTSTDVDEWRNLLLTEVIEPALGKTFPEIIYDWPATQSALAIVRDEVPNVAERFELYYHGVELANGYHELLDADELARRNEKINKQRVNDGNPMLPEKSRLMDAMRHGLPSCSGVAVGFDRLVMLATGHDEIREVIAFDFPRA